MQNDSTWYYYRHYSDFTSFVACPGGRGFVEVKEFSIPDAVKSMSWCGENICLGYRREYVILNSTNGALSNVFPSGRTAPPLVVSLPSGELLLGKVYFVLISGLGDYFTCVTLWDSTCCVRLLTSYPIQSPKLNVCPRTLTILMVEIEHYHLLNHV